MCFFFFCALSSIDQLATIPKYQKKDKQQIIFTIKKNQLENLPFFLEGGGGYSIYILVYSFYYSSYATGKCPFTILKVSCLDCFD